MSFSVVVIMIFQGISRIVEKVGQWLGWWTLSKVADKEKEQVKAHPTFTYSFSMLIGSTFPMRFCDCLSCEQSLQNKYNVARSPPDGALMCQF